MRTTTSQCRRRDLTTRQPTLLLLNQAMGLLAPYQLVTAVVQLSHRLPIIARVSRRRNRWYRCRSHSHRIRQWLLQREALQTDPQAQEQHDVQLRRAPCRPSLPP